MQTLKQVEKEAQRRVREDDCPRVVYFTEGMKWGVCLIVNWEERPVTDRGVSIVWPDKIEAI